MGKIIEVTNLTKNYKQNVAGSQKLIDKLLLRLLLTFIIPYAFVSYYPALYILGKASNMFDSFMIYLEPFLVCLFVLLAYNIWRKGTYVYKGTGT